MSKHSFSFTHSIGSRTARLVFAACVLSLGTARAVDIPAVLDDFSDPTRSSVGADRILVDDSSVGGKSFVKQTFADGVLTATGEIAPPRGQPGWVSMVLLVSPTGAPADVSQYEGVRLRVRVKQGLLSISANSSEVTNFDYHASLVPVKAGEIQEVRLPFKDMKRAWSEQIPLNRATIASISFVAVDFQKGAFAYEVDEIGFY